MLTILVVLVAPVSLWTNLYLQHLLTSFTLSFLGLLIAMHIHTSTSFDLFIISDVVLITPDGKIQCHIMRSGPRYLGTGLLQSKLIQVSWTYKSCNGIMITHMVITLCTYTQPGLSVSFCSYLYVCVIYKSPVLHLTVHKPSPRPVYCLLLRFTCRQWCCRYLVSHRLSARSVPFY